MRVLEASAPELVNLRPEADTVCGLGCGGGSKDKILLQAFQQAGRPPAYVAVDFSQSLLELALAASDGSTLSAHGTKLDLMSDNHLQTLSGQGRSCIFATLGNTLGAFDPLRFPKRLRRIMRPTDRTLFDGEVFDRESTLSGYDNPTNRRFAFGPLAALGLTEQNGDLNFELRPGREGIHEMAKYFVAGRNLELRIDGTVMHLEKDEKVLMSSSIKSTSRYFSPSSIAADSKSSWTEGVKMESSCWPRPGRVIDKRI